MTLQMAQANIKANEAVGGPTPFNQPNWCLQWCVQTIYDFHGPFKWGGNGKPWAINYWEAAKKWGKVFQTGDPNAIPAGAMTFSKGASVYGHVFIADGKGGCYTTDYPQSRKIGHVPIPTLMRAWGHQLLGYVLVTGEGIDLQNHGSVPVAPTITVWDQLSWNVASPKWYTPWEPRQAAIGASIRGDASVNCFQEVFSAEQVGDIQRALGAGFTRVEGPAGLEIFYDSSRWEGKGVEIHHVGPQGRALMAVELVRRQTGRHVRIGNTHAPALSPVLRSQFGKNIEPIIADLDVLTGDFNTGKSSLSPRKNIEAAGFRNMREQCSVQNGGMAEFPTKAKWLADIYSHPSRKVKITYGELHLTTARESDHRELTARLEAR